MNKQGQSFGVLFQRDIPVRNWCHGVLRCLYYAGLSINFNEWSSGTHASGKASMHHSIYVVLCFLQYEITLSWYYWFDKMKAQLYDVDSCFQNCHWLSKAPIK